MDQEPTYEDLKKRVAELENEVSQYQIDSFTKFPEILCAILEAFRYIPACKKFEDAAKKIFEQCKKMIGARSGYVALLSENGEENEVLFLDAGGLPCDVDPDLPMPIRGLREIAYKTKEVAYDNDFFESPWMDFMPQGHVRLDNVLFAPINIQERTVGIIGIANKPEGFCKRDVDIAKIFGELAAVALTYTKSQELLRASEDHYRSLFNNVNDAVFVHKVMPDGQPGNFLYVNQAAQDMIGYTEQELQSMSPWALDNPETSIKIIPEVMRQLFKKKKARFESVQIAKNKQKIYVEVNSILTQIQDQEYILSVCRDISDHKQYEEDLLASKERFEKIFQSTPALISISKIEDGTYLEVNDAFVQSTGYAKENVIGKTSVEIGFISRKYRNRLKQNLLKKGRVQNLE